MKVHLKIILPVLPEAVGRKEFDVEFAGETVNDLLQHLVAQYGRKAKQALYDERGELDPVIQVLLNGQEWITHDRPARWGTSWLRGAKLPGWHKVMSDRVAADGDGLYRPSRSQWTVAPQCGHLPVR